MNIDITSSTTVKDIVVRHPQARHVLETLGIDYCCGGKATLAQAAKQAGLSTDQILADLEQVLTTNPPDAALARDWSSVSPTDLADHVEQTHHVFMKEQLPRLAGLLAKTIQAHHEHHGQMLEQLRRHYTSLKTDIEMHLAKEEQILFPLIRKMEACEQDRGPAPEMHCGSIANPIRQMEHEHNVAGDLLAQMRHVTKGYTLPSDACQTFAALYEGLDALEKDLHEHIHLENNILFPKAQALQV
jgi:regulator of cell morphogenesis and NO signaling